VRREQPRFAGVVVDAMGELEDGRREIGYAQDAIDNVSCIEGFGRTADPSVCLP
jgi:hypothetical protein